MNTPINFSTLSDSREYSPTLQNSFSVTLNLSQCDDSEHYITSEISQISTDFEIIQDQLKQEQESSNTDDLTVQNQSSSSFHSDSSSRSSSTKTSIKSFSVAQSTIDTQLVLNKAKTATISSFLDQGFIKGIAKMFQK